MINKINFDAFEPLHDALLSVVSHAKRGDGLADLAPQSLVEAKSNHKYTLGGSQPTKTPVATESPDLNNLSAMEPEKTAYCFFSKSEVSQPVDQPLNITINIEQGETRSAMTMSMEQLKSIFGEHANFWAPISITVNNYYYGAMPGCQTSTGDIGGLSIADLEPIEGETADEKEKNMGEVGTKLHDELRKLGGKKSGMSRIITAVLKESIDSGLMRFVPKVGLFNRLFKPYLADNIVSIADGVYNNNVKGPLSRMKYVCDTVK